MSPYYKKQFLFIGKENILDQFEIALKTFFPEADCMETETFESASNLLAQTNISIIFAHPKINDISLFDWIQDHKDRNFQWVVLAENLDHLSYAFEYGAAGYLQVPFQKDQLKQTLAYLSQQNLNLNAVTPSLDENTLNPDIPFLAKEILMIASDGDYAQVHLKDAKKEKVQISINLKKAEKLLEPHGFFRVHHQFLVNTQYVKNGGELYPDGITTKRYIRLVNDQRVEVARRRRKAFKEYVKGQ